MTRGWHARGHGLLQQGHGSARRQAALLPGGLTLGFWWPSAAVTSSATSLSAKQKRCMVPSDSADARVTAAALSLNFSSSTAAGESEGGGAGRRQWALLWGRDVLAPGACCGAQAAGRASARGAFERQER